MTKKEETDTRPPQSEIPELITRDANGHTYSQAETAAWARPKDATTKRDRMTPARERIRAMADELGISVTRDEEEKFAVILLSMEDSAA